MTVTDYITLPHGYVKDAAYIENEIKDLIKDEDCLMYLWKCKVTMSKRIVYVEWSSDFDNRKVVWGQIKELIYEIVEGS